jgi:PhnB protein
MDGDGSAAAVGELTTTIAPWLTVGDGAAALEFYRAAFGATERERLDDNGRVIVARLAIGDAEFWFQEDLDGLAGVAERPIRMILTVTDPDALFARAVAAGATEVFPVGDGNGWHVGRVADPDGHHWEIGRPLPAGKPTGPAPLG